jgi:glyoxylase-like metal-dependent hydrolase (beta-lactamase superfamily II)
VVIQQHTINTDYLVGPVHCYSGELGGDLVLFDTGPPTSEAQVCLREELDLSRLRHVVITHYHIDHCGLASWLEKESDAYLYLPYRDTLKINGHEERLEKLAELLLQTGFDQRYLENFLKVMNTDEVFPEFPEKFLTVESGLPEHLGIEVIACPGHSQSDLVLAGPDWAVTGDVLLKGIFQAPLLDIDLETGERFRNYEAYCTTLVKLATLRGRQILPGHRNSIDSIDDTILFYVGKLLDRATQLKRFSNKDSVAHIVGQLFGDGQGHPFHYYLKASELVFMRDLMHCPEHLRSSLEQIGLFEPISEKFLQTAYD